jgi:hypothetical protein
MRCGMGVTASVLCAMLFQPALAQQTPAEQHASATHSSDPVANDLPQLVDITAKTGIHFTHLSSPNKKYIVESMRAGSR